ncbi:hypothetical protein [Micromonospora globosa]|uniref:hypothetical protein n=1 Tax=Micromonospora globosa TaxID=47863 RepID=UPI0004C0B22F|nr:hypothetical protein [Micromonospora globosa]
MHRTRPRIFVAGHAADVERIKLAAAELAAAGFAVATPDFTPALDADDLLARVADDLAAVEAAAVVAYLPGAEDTLEVAHAELYGVPTVRLADVLALAVTR